MADDVTVTARLKDELSRPIHKVAPAAVFAAPVRRVARRPPRRSRPGGPVTLTVGYDEGSTAA